VIDVQHPFHRLCRLMARLLLRALLRMAVLLLRRPVLLLRRWSAFRRLRGGVSRRLRLSGLGRRPFRQALLHRRFLRSVVLDVDDPALRVQRRRHLALPLAALAPPPPPASAVPPEAAASTALTLLSRPQLDVAVAVHPGLRIAGVAGLGSIRRGLRGVRWCGGRCPSPFIC